MSENDLNKPFTALLVDQPVLSVVAVQDVLSALSKRMLKEAMAARKTIKTRTDVADCYTLMGQADAYDEASLQIVEALDKLLSQTR